ECAPPVEEPAPAVEDFAVAGADWLLGNSVPLVEVAVTGGLVLRLADERWALGDVPAAVPFPLGGVVDLRLGPGLAILLDGVVVERPRHRDTPRRSALNRPPSGDRR